jgi:DNA-binding LacI/PurR family transcriptional regulator
MADVARRLGVSSATVSRALRNHPAIPEKTRLAVRQAANRLGYVCSPLLGALMTQVRRRQPATGVNLSCCFEPHPEANLRRAQEEILGAFRETATQLGYGIEFDAWALSCANRPGALERQWQARGVAGVFLHNIRATSPISFPWAGYCWVVAGNMSGVPSLHRVGNEIHQLVKLAVGKAVEQGYRRPGLAVPVVGERREGLRWAGAFYACSLDLSPPIDQPLIFRRSWQEAEFRAWLDKEKPDVVIGLTDEVVTWLQRMPGWNRELPAFIHLAANTSAFDAAGVVQDFRATGIAAAQVLDSLIRSNGRGIPTRPTTLTVAGTWKDGTL